MKMGKGKKQKRKRVSGCEDCYNLIPTGEGCFFCMEDAEPREVIDEYITCGRIFLVWRKEICIGGRMQYE